MLEIMGDIKHSATWGGGKSNPAPANGKGGPKQPSRKQPKAKSAAQFAAQFTF